MRQAVEIDVVSPSVYTDEELISGRFRELRQKGPIHWIHHDEYRPFWGIFGQPEIQQIESDPQLWINEPRVTLVPTDIEDKTIEMFGKRYGFVRTLIDMDQPDHRKYRQVAQSWFTPRALKQLEERMAALASDYVDKMEAMGGTCDFADDIALTYPLVMITTLLGLPDSDAPLVLKLTQELFGAMDPELQRSGDFGLETAQHFFFYLGGILQERREKPTDDLMSLVANSTIDGEPMPPLDALAYGLLLATAGHDTTSSSVGVGMMQFAKNPDQFALLKHDPETMAVTAADEIFRWASPVRHMMRTATADTEVAGQPIKAGESVCLFYAAANRDERIFDEPYKFDITRKPNRHVGFGYGVHHCLGRILAEMEVIALFREIGRRVESVELAGEPVWVRTNFTGGLKRLPIRYTMKAE